MADNTDNRDGQGGEELPDDLKRLVDAAEEDAADAGEQDVEQPEPGHTVTSGPVSEEDKARSLIDMSTVANPPRLHHRGRKRRRRHHRSCGISGQGDGFFVPGVFHERHR